MQKNIENIIKDIEFLKIVKPILETKEFQKRITYKHFNNISMYEHALQNSYLNYKYALKYHFNKEEIIEATIAGLLHNFYPITKESKKQKTDDALINSIAYFRPLITPSVANAIACHKFPYTPTKMPNNKVSALVNHTDSILKAKNTSSKDNIEKHISTINNEIPISFKQMHRLFHEFLEEYQINIDNKILSTITSIKLRSAFYEYLQNKHHEIDKTLLGEAIIETVKREELLSKINFIINNIKGYSIDELSSNLKTNQKTKSQK